MYRSRAYWKRRKKSYNCNYHFLFFFFLRQFTYNSQDKTFIDSWSCYSQCPRSVIPLNKILSHFNGKSSCFLRYHINKIILPLGQTSSHYFIFTIINVVSAETWDHSSMLVALPTMPLQVAPSYHESTVAHHIRKHLHIHISVEEVRKSSVSKFKCHSSTLRFPCAPWWIIPSHLID